MPNRARAQRTSFSWSAARVGLATAVALVGVSCTSGGAGPGLAAPTMVPSDPPPDLAAAEPTVAPTSAATPGPTDRPPGPARLVLDVGEVVVDPVSASVTSPAQLQVLDLVYDGVTEWDAKTGTWRLLLARSFEASDDGLVWDIVPDPQARFSDGSAISAADVARSLRAALGAAGSAASLRLDVVETIEVVEQGAAQTVRILLRHPDPGLPAVLTNPLFGVTPDGPLDGSIGSGPYVLAEPGLLTPVDSVVGLPEMVLSADDPDISFMADAEGVSPAYVATLVEVHYGINTRAPALSDPTRRAAVVDAVDRAELAELLGPGATAVGSLSPELVPCSSDCDPETAEVDVPALHVDYVNDETGVEAALAERLAAQLSAGGIPARARAHDLEEFVGLVVEGRHEVFRTGWVGLAPEYDGLLSPYLSGSPDNRTGLSDPELDEAMALARRSEDPGAYAAAVVALEAAYVVVPVARVGYAVVLSPELAGLRFGPLGTFDAFDLGSLL